MADMSFKFTNIRYMVVALCILVTFSIMYTSTWHMKIPPYEPGDIEKTAMCKESLLERRHLPAAAAGDKKTLYLVTPTYRRVEQVAELTRVGQMLLTVPNVVWVLVEDADSCSQHVAELLERLAVPYVHMASPMPPQYRAQTYVPRGVSNRRAALKWLRAQKPPPTGVLYFLDDDNTIDIRLLEQMRQTKKVSMFPVGLLGDTLVSSPIVKDGRVTGWFDSWIAGRKFPVDMAGFALSLDLILNSKGTMPYHAGYEEDKLLQALNIKMEEIEVMANGCTEIMVWHTKTKKNQPAELASEVAKHPNSNMALLVENMARVAMATT